MEWDGAGVWGLLCFHPVMIKITIFSPIGLDLGL
jgi:hypothetical protein